MVDIISPTVAPADKPNPDTDAVVQFLKLFAPDGPWILAALKPAGGGPEVKTFGPDAEADARSWKDNATGRVMSLRIIGWQRSNPPQFANPEACRWAGRI